MGGGIVKVSNRTIGRLRRYSRAANQVAGLSMPFVGSVLAGAVFSHQDPLTVILSKLLAGLFALLMVTWYFGALVYELATQAIDRRIVEDRARRHGSKSLLVDDLIPRMKGTTSFEAAVDAVDATADPNFFGPADICGGDDPKPDGD
jgi:hypothetical protein